MHPQLALRGISVGNDALKGIIDVTLVDDMYELLAATDAFVSDYSSAAFEAALLRIPVFLYVDNLDDYVADRGKLLWNVEDIPFPMVKNNNDLRKVIEKFDLREYLEKLEQMFNCVGLVEDGMATNRVINMIKNNM